jgi:WD40 repeat protein
MRAGLGSHSGPSADSTTLGIGEIRSERPVSWQLALFYCRPPVAPAIVPTLALARAFWNPVGSERGVGMGYDVFVSYSHTGDDLLSERVQNGLARFAKPWWRRRAINVFRDHTALSANPGLWSSIASAIDDSRYFLMLASPEAAASAWVAREVGQWRAKHGSDHLLVLLTDGEIVWDNDANDFDWQRTTALGAGAFAGCFVEEPRHVDMRWARSEVQLDLTDGRFRDQIAELAAPVHGMAKDELAGADVRQHRRTLRHAFAAGVALALLTLASIATSAYAVNSASAARRSAAQARTEQKRADDQATIASRESEAATRAGKLADQRRQDADRQRGLALARQHDAQVSASEANRQRGIAFARQGEAQLSASEANQQRGLADARARDVAAANGNLVLVNGRLVDQRSLTESQRAAAVANALEADQQRKLADARALQAKRNQEEADRQRAAAVSNATRAENQRLGSVARALTAGSAATLADGVTDRSLLLAAEATKFAARSGGNIGDDVLRPALVNALQRNPRQVGALRGLDGPIADVAVAPDGTRAAAVSLDGHAAVWEVHDQQLLSNFAVLTGADSVRFLTPDTLVVAGEQQLDAYRTRDNGATWTFEWRWHATNTNVIWTIAATPTRLLIASTTPDPSGGGPGPSSTVDLIDATGVPLGSTPVSDPVQRIAFAPSGMTFATAGIGFDPADPTGHTYRIVAHVFAAPKTEIAAFGVDPGDVVPERVGGGDVRFSSDGRQLTVLLAGFAVPLHRWDIATQHEIAVPPPGFGWAAVVRGRAFGLSNNLDAIVQRDTTDHNVVGVGHISTGAFTGTIDAPVAPDVVDPFRPPAFTPDGQAFLLSGADSIVPVFELPDVPHSHFAVTRSLAPSQGFVCDAAISPDGRVLAVLGEAPTTATLRLTTLDGSRAPINISLSQEPQCGTFFGHSVAFGDGAEFAIADTDGSVDVYDTTGTRRLHLKPQETCDPNYCGPGIAFSGSLQSGRIAESHNDNGEVWIWELRSGAAVASHIVRFPGKSFTFAVQLSASGSRLVVTSISWITDQSATHVFDATAQGWSERTSFPVPSSLFKAEALSPDGSRLVVSDGERVAMHDLDRARVTWTTARGEPDLGAWFGPDGTLYTASGFGAIRIRSTADGSTQYVLNPTAAGGSSQTPSALVATGSHLVTAVTSAFFTDPATVTVTDWAFGTTDLAAAACKEAGRNLTPAEWKKYVSTFDAYEKTCPNLP